MRSSRRVTDRPRMTSPSPPCLLKMARLRPSFPSPEPAGSSKRGSGLKAGFEVRLVEAELLCLFQRVGAKAHRAIFADDLSVGAFVHILELEQLLGDDDVAFHADHFRDVGGSARTVAEA